MRRAGVIPKSPECGHALAGPHQREPPILPPLTLNEALETTKIHGIVGLLAPGQALVTQRPFRTPHHTASGDADLLVAPVTSQAARSPRDVPEVDWQRAGLRLPSLARLEKLATVEKTTVVRKMGRLTPDDWEKCRAVLRQIFTDILAR